MVCKKKKGVSWLEWILLLSIMVAMAMTVLFWAKARTEKLTESTVDYVEGRMECQSIRIAATPNPPICNSVEVSNKGTLSIKQTSLRLTDINGITSSIIDETVIKPTETETLNIGEVYTKLEIVPIIEVGENLFGCSDKKLRVECT